MKREREREKEISLTFSHWQRSKFPYGCADVAKESGRKGSNVYEVKQWQRMFERGKPLLESQCSKGFGGPVRRGMNPSRQVRISVV